MPQALGSTNRQMLTMSPEREHQVITMAKRLRATIPALQPLNDRQLLTTTWTSFKRIDQTSDSDYHTMATIFYQELDRRFHHRFTTTGQGPHLQQQLFALLTEVLA